MRCNTGQVNEQNLTPEDGRLRELLQTARTTPILPPRFQENVWHRIKASDNSSRTTEAGHWLDGLATWMLRPRLAFALAAALVLAGLGLGWSKGEQLARDQAQQRYLAAVAPNSLR